MKILLIDDSEIIRHRLKELLQETLNVEKIIEAADGVEGVEKFWRCRPDVVVVDLNLPKLDGIQVLQNIKGNGITSVVIVLTVFTSEFYKEICFQEGADYFLDKSHDFEKVYDICKNLLDKK
jgi:DNA-binding NarL/FixJ family response regulator